MFRNASIFFTEKKFLSGDENRMMLSVFTALAEVVRRVLRPDRYPLFAGAIFLFSIFMLLVSGVAHAECWIIVKPNQITNFKGTDPQYLRESDDIYTELDTSKEFGGVKEFGVNPVVMTEANDGFIDQIIMGIEYNTANFVNDILNLRKTLLIPNPPGWNAVSVANLPYANNRIDITQEYNANILDSHAISWAKIENPTSGFQIQIAYVKVGKEDAGATFYGDFCYLKVLVKLSVFRTNLAPATVTEGTENVPMLSLELKPYGNNTIDLNGLKIERTGTCLDSDIAAVKIVRDLDSDGQYDAGEPVLGSGTFSSGILTISGSPLIDNISNGTRLLVCYSFANTVSVPGRTAGARLTDETNVILAGTVDRVATNQDAVDAGLGSNYFWPINSGLTTIIRKATLTASFTSPPTSTVYMGDPITVTMRIDNAPSCGTAVGVLPKPQPLTIISGSGGNATTSDSYVTQGDTKTVTGGNYCTFTWNYIASAAGTVQFQGYAYGTDEISTKVVTSSTATSNTVTILPKPVPVLNLEITINPIAVSDDGQTFVVSAKVTNTGTATATGVTLYKDAGLTIPWDFTLIGTPTATKESGSWSSQDIPPNSSYTWNFTYTATYWGGTNNLLQFRCYAKATNSSSVNTTSAPISIYKAATCTLVSLTATPSPVAVGVNSTITLKLKIKNEGQSGLADCIPSVVAQHAVSGSPALPLTKTSGPVPSIYSLVGGETKEFYWTYRAGPSPGVMHFHVVASGKDGRSLKTKSMPDTPSNDVSIEYIVSPYYIATPSVSGDIRDLISVSEAENIYTTNESNTILAFNPIGTQKWSLNLGVTLSNKAIAVSEEGSNVILYVGTGNGRLYAIKDNGTSAGGKWAANATDSWVSLGTTDPVYGGPIVYFVGNTGYIITVAGRRVTKRLASNGGLPSGWTDFNASANVECIPTVDNNYIYFGDNNGNFYALNFSTGAKAFAERNLGAPVQRSPFIYSYGTNDSWVFVSAGSRLWKLKSTDFTNGINVNLGGTLTDPWVDMYGNFVYVTTGNGTTLEKRNTTNLTTSGGGFSVNYSASHNITNMASSPLQLFNFCYFGATRWDAIEGENDGVVVKVSASNGTVINLWPYHIDKGPVLSPVSLIWKGQTAGSHIVVGSDSDKIYGFDL